MLQEWLSLLPPEIGPAASVVALIGAGVGLVLWFIGARLSRATITLAMLTCGAGIGMELPRWCGWQISGAGPAVGGAVVLGFLGYALHALWVGVELGTLLACWAGLITWALLHGVAPVDWPAVQPGMSIMGLAQAVWQSLPGEVTKIMPYSVGLGMLSGIALGILWPRVAVVLAWSLAGSTILVACGIVAMRSRWPSTMSLLPAQTPMQAGSFLALVAAGAVMQWKLLPRAKAAEEDGNESDTAKRLERCASSRTAGAAA